MLSSRSERAHFLWPPCMRGACLGCRRTGTQSCTWCTRPKFFGAPRRDVSTSSSETVHTQIAERTGERVGARRTDVGAHIGRANKCTATLASQAPQNTLRIKCAPLMMCTAQRRQTAKHAGMQRRAALHPTLFAVVGSVTNLSIHSVSFSIS